MPWYLYLALKQLFPSRRFFSFFSFMSIIGVMLGVAVLIIVQSVMNGFGEDIRKTMVETYGDLRVTSDRPVYDWQELMGEIEAHPQVAAVTPYTEGMVMLQVGDTPAFPFIRGIDPLREVDVLPLEKFLKIGTLDDLYDGSIFVSEGLAHALGAYPGAVVEVYTPLMLERLKEDEVLLPREFEVAGVFATGMSEIDSNTVICTMRVMQELYGLGRGVHGFTVRLQARADVHQAVDDLGNRLDPSLSVVSWMRSHQAFLDVLILEKTLISFIIIFIILVASFSIAIALMMTVLRKTREIGLIVAMGGTATQVAACFCLQGLVIGVTGTLMGIGFALVCLRYRSSILQLLPNNDQLLGQYPLNYLPVHYMASDFVVVTLFAIIISTLAGLLPAWRAARLKPADALRSE